MKKNTIKTLIVLSFLFSVAHGFANECKVNFYPQSLDYVVVQNLTKGTSVTIDVAAGDSLRLIDQQTAVEELKDNHSDIRILYNADGTEELSFYSKLNGNAQINVLSIDGKRITSINQFLDEGTNNFQLTLPFGVFVVQVIGKGYTYSVKAINSTKFSVPSITYKSRTALNVKATIRKAEKVSESGKIIYLYCENGDNLLFKGVSGNYASMVSSNLNSWFWDEDFNYKFGMACNFQLTASCVDDDNYVYAVVPIGLQVWMAENLKVTRYNDGTPIPNVTDATAWAGLSTGAYCWYDNDISNKATYGALYNLYAVNAGKLAPKGWHVATDAEWAALTNYLGGAGVAGDKLKEAGTAHWNSPNTEATNKTGFTALPGGTRSDDGTYDLIETNGCWWSAPEGSSSYTWYRDMGYCYSNVYSYDYNKKAGFSVRCVRDSTSANVYTTTPVQKYATVSVGGGINDFGGSSIKECGVCYSTSPNPTISDTKLICDGSNLGMDEIFSRTSFENNIIGLTPSTTYYFRAYAINGSGLSYGDVIAFTTAAFDKETVFKKLYSTLALTGDQQPSGNPDIIGIDEGTDGSFIRSVWQLNELGTDEAICAWGDSYCPILNFNRFNASVNVIDGMYKRLFFNLKLCTYFIDNTSSLTDEVTLKQRAEARFLRALNYSYLLDMFGNVPIPELSITQATIDQLYNYLQTELATCETDLYSARTAPYYRVDKVADWLLRSRLYLNAQVYTGTADWNNAALYAKKVIDSNYSLCPTYSQLFMADNGGTNDNSSINQAPSEMILPIYCDGVKSKSWSNSLFLIASTHASDMPDFGTNNYWEGNRARKALADKFYSSQIYTTGDISDIANDKRAMFYSWSGVNPATITDVSVFKQGLSVMKWTNVRADGSAPSDAQFTDTDVPLLRKAEAYLTYSEAIMRGASTIDGYTALNALNVLRSRANATTLSTVSLLDICDEWSREFYFEGRRRMDLIRFGKYGGQSNYIWDWQSGKAAGTSFAAYFNLFPIPDSELATNPNLAQNPEYGVNHNPVAGTYNVTVAPNTTQNITPNSVMNDVDGDNITITSISNPINGVAVLSSNTITYTPNTDYIGSDSLNYNISDGNGGTATGKILITVVGSTYDKVTLRPWYIVGLGDKQWNNSYYGLGKSLIPLSVVSGSNKYNTITGDGKFTYTGYFEAAEGFRLIRDIGSWSEQWGMSGGIYVHNDGGSNNITVPSDGWYKITLNSISNTLTIEPTTTPSSLYSTMGLIGEFNAWASDNVMMPAFTSNNHVWYTTFTFSSDFSSGSGCKFRANGGWDVNWGANYFPVGLGIQNGANIPFYSGTYTIIINDIDGCYYFIRQ